MLYTTWKIGEEEYKLRLTTWTSLQVEKQLGMGITEAVNHLADTSVIVTLLWGGLQAFHHGMNLRDVCALYDKYIASGGGIEKIMDVLTDLLSQVGYGSSSSAEKNAQSLTDVPNIEV
jgi:hypothetical protein